VNGRRAKELRIIVGTVLCAAVLVTFRELVVDIAFTWLDPRAKDS